MLKVIHVTAVILSFTGFFARGVLMAFDSALLNARWVRIAPHIVDTALLISAIALAVQVHQYPFVHTWLTAKALALLSYIALGTIALRRGRTKPLRVVAWVTALLVFAYIVAVARTRSPTLWLF